MKEKETYQEKINKLVDDGYCVFKGVGDGENVDVWHAFGVWHDCGFLNVYLLYDWQHGNSYYFLKGSKNKLLNNILPKNVKAYDVCNVKTFIKERFPYFNEAKKFAERLSGKVVCTKNPKLIKEFDNEEFFQVVNAFLDDSNAYVHYFDEDEQCVIAGEFMMFIEWMKKHKYPMRKPEWYNEDEECDETEMEPDVDFEFF